MTVVTAANRSLADWLVWIAISIVGAVSLAVMALYRGETINALWLVTAAVAVYLIAFRFYARYVETRVLGVDETRSTPAHRHNDGLDYVPTDKWVLFGHHFAAIDIHHHLTHHPQPAAAVAGDHLGAHQFGAQPEAIAGCRGVRVGGGRGGGGQVPGW